MSIIDSILLIFSIGITFYLIILGIILFSIYRLTKKYPISALFILLILIAIGITGSFNPISFTPAVITLSSSTILLFSQYKKFKKAIKKILK